ncbi:MAG TPA: hypothetical protein PK836_05830 [Syntrophales bacterium]|nr:hypothetical protein [Syntrophales bacterium]HOM07845.1 hypothetical protein [Syntrophales bacterium]HOO00522.1 hypothetical protein [Syntrophales bacterium]HPC01189.1 hypothetical protein [Syntrophales bacterium]HPQ07307.1 hypothetical protein [Syntrophales bacterium]
MAKQVPTRRQKDISRLLRRRRNLGKDVLKGRRGPRPRKTR